MAISTADGEGSLKKGLAEAALLSPTKLRRVSAKRDGNDFSPKSTAVVGAARAQLEYSSKEQLTLSQIAQRVRKQEQSVLLGQTAYCLSKWVQDFVFQGEPRGHLQVLTLTQISKINLTLKQQEHWLAFKQWAAQELSPVHLKEVDKYLRAQTFEAAHGSREEQQRVTQQDLLAWADELVTEPALQSAVKRYIALAAKLSTTQHPLLLDKQTLS